MERALFPATKFVSGLIGYFLEEDAIGFSTESLFPSGSPCCFV